MAPAFLQSGSDMPQNMVSVDASQLDVFDAAAGTSFSIFPDSLYTISDMVNILRRRQVSSVNWNFEISGSA